LPAADQAQEPAAQQSFEELRNTVINLLESLVEKGVITREQASGMVARAQEQAGKVAATAAATAAAEKDAVRVTYVPESIRRQIGFEVRADIREEVAEDVLQQAMRRGLGSVPEWLRSVKVTGDVRARAERSGYAEGNAVNVYQNFSAINAAGGRGKAGVDALLNTTEDRLRMVGRARLGLAAELGGAWDLELRLASGSAGAVTSTNQTLGAGSARWTTGVDRALLRWNPRFGRDRQEFELRAGRFGNPYFGTSELIWDADLAFEGLTLRYGFDLFQPDAQHYTRGLYLTVGGSPLQEVELSTRDKWLYAAQLGAEIPLGEASRLHVAAGVYDFRNITGRRNALDNTLYDFTAPRFLQKGNTLFDIRNDADTSTNLYALAGEYRLATASLQFDAAAFGSNHLIVGADYVRNIGWKAEEVMARIGYLADERVEGYDVNLTIGRPALTAWGHWRAFGGYRYVERDAVLDAFNDSDFHLGGTDARGYQLGFDLGLAARAWLRLRLLSATEVDGPPLGIDVWQLDVNGQF
jgi:hypothetical protein